MNIFSILLATVSTKLERNAYMLKVKCFPVIVKKLPLNCLSAPIRSLSTVSSFSSTRLNCSTKSTMCSVIIFKYWAKSKSRYV